MPSLIPRPTGPAPALLRLARDHAERARRLQEAACEGGGLDTVGRKQGLREAELLAAEATAIVEALLAGR